MEIIIQKLKKYQKDESLIGDIILFLNNNYQIKDEALFDIEYILSFLKECSLKISKSELSSRRKQVILSLLNEVIVYYNDKFMTILCDKL